LTEEIIDMQTMAFGTRGRVALEDGRLGEISGRRRQPFGE
jgi:hypothetical protein